MRYEVILDTFQGPLDLLLHLIDKAEVDIYDIPISEITEQYIIYIKKMHELDLKVTSEFLLMASTLLEIKSKMLLPKDIKNKECKTSDENEESDPRLDLVEKLVEYRKYKMVSKKFKKREKIQRKVFNKPKEDLSYIIDNKPSLEELDLEQLVLTLNNILKNQDKNYKPLRIDEIQRDEYTLSKCIERISNKLKENKKMKFSKLFNKNTTKNEIVVTFLSVLELAKLKKITIIQEKNFSDILIIQSNDREI